MWNCSQIIPIGCRPMFLCSLTVQIKYNSTFFLLFFYQVGFTHVHDVVFLCLFLSTERILGLQKSVF